MGDSKELDTSFDNIASDCGGACNDLPGGLNGIGNKDLCIPDAKVELKLSRDSCTDDFFDLLKDMQGIRPSWRNTVARNAKVLAARVSLDNCAKKSWQMFPFTKVQR